MNETVAKHGTGIEWTHGEGFKGETWNPTTGCDRVSPGCAHCYALDLASRLKGMGQPRYQRDGDPRTSGPGFGLTLHPDKLDEPLRWSKPRMVFVNSMSDLFHEGVDPDFTAHVFATMAAARHHVFQILTKRPERAREIMAGVAGAEFEHRVWDLADTLVESRLLDAEREWFETNPDAPLSHNVGLSWPLPNVWLGVSIENARYTWRADVLREIPAAVRFISAEPLLGSLFEGTSSSRSTSRRAPETATDDEIEGSPATRDRAPLDLSAIDWLIVGGESGGRDSRPMHPDWARELRDACGAGEADFDYLGPDPNAMNGEAWGYRPRFFFKQWGSWAPGPSIDTAADHVFPDGLHMRYAGAGPKSGGRLLDGREWSEMPQ